MKEKSRGIKETKKAPQLSLKEKRKLKKEKKSKYSDRRRQVDTSRTKRSVSLPSPYFVPGKIFLSPSQASRNLLSEPRSVVIRYREPYKGFFAFEISCGRPHAQME